MLLNNLEANYIGRFAHLSKYVGQGACLIDDNHLLRYAQETKTDKGLVDIVDLKTNTITQKGNNFFWGHGNSITCDGNFLYVVPMSHYEGNHCYLKLIYKIDIKTLKTIKTYTLPFNVYSCSYDKKTKNFYVVNLGNTHTIYKWNPETNETQKLFTLPQPFKINRLQGVVVNNNIIYVLYFDPNIISTYTLNGELISSIQLSNKIGFMEAQELEAIDFTSDEICYIISNGYYNGGTYKFEFVGALGLEKGNLYSFQDEIDNYAYSILSHVDAKKNIFTTFYADGTESAPFPTIQEGVMHHINDPWSTAVQLAKGTYNETVRVSRKYDGYLQIQAADGSRAIWKGSFLIWTGNVIFRYIDFVNSNNFCINFYDFGILHLHSCSFNGGNHYAVNMNGPIYLKGTYQNKGKVAAFRMETPAPVYGGDSMKLKSSDFKWTYPTSQIWLPTASIKKG